MEKDLKKMRRSELLEVLILQAKEIEELKGQNADLRKQLDKADRELTSRRITIKKAGSLAEASLALSSIFQSADEAAAKYLENVRILTSQQEQICAQRDSESHRKSQQLLTETEKKCLKMIEETKKKCRNLLLHTQEKAKTATTKVSP